jgi:prepilin-type N-terminal cleavage/methylation domain-containing protein
VGTMQHRAMAHRLAPKGGQGFSLIEMVIAMAMILVLGAIFTPSVSNAISMIKLRSSANGLSGLIQKARIEAARKNTFYSIEQTTLSGGWSHTLST